MSSSYDSFNENRESLYLSNCVINGEGLLIPAHENSQGRVSVPNWSASTGWGMCDMHSSSQWLVDIIESRSSQGSCSRYTIKQWSRVRVIDYAHCAYMNPLQSDVELGWVWFSRNEKRLSLPVTCHYVNSMRIAVHNLGQQWLRILCIVCIVYSSFSMWIKRNLKADDTLFLPNTALFSYQVLRTVDLIWHRVPSRMAAGAESFSSCSNLPWTISSSS